MTSKEQSALPTNTCHVCRQEIASIFQVRKFEVDDCSLDPPSVWRDYCYSVCDMNHDQLERMVLELSDPQFEFSSIEYCHPSWLQVDKRMLQIAAEAFLTNDHSKMTEPSEAA
jgi:hypothetical protein